MHNNQYAYRIRLEKLKQKTWRLIILARIILFLSLVIVRYL